ncbi:dynein axonemal intermediate chain 7 [Brachionichthys hirsutus]|uniref:dynein axonemal intermediate chain 7 n=1 Tax=Brachionichthys hirsutus TaxID=412623 RepID=UPI00360515B5
MRKSSKKKTKTSKAQKEKRQKEEEERRLREEEEARLQAEKEEQERLHREKKERELELLAIKDRERREGELNELQSLLEQNHAAVTRWKTEAAEMAKWERYMRCDGSPDPAVQRDINTFITLWRDDPEVDHTLVLKQCNIALQLIEELEVLLRDATVPQEAQKYQEAIIQLQELIQHKHHVITEEILKRASESADTNTGNMQVVINGDNITMCLWANICKNPRFNGLNFEEVGLGFELPKQLASRDIAVRILHTRYDHLSSLSRMTHLRIHAPSQRFLAAPGDASEQREEGGDGEANEDESRPQITEEETQSIQDSETRERAASRQTSRTSAQQTQVQTQIEALGAELDSTSCVQLPGDEGVQVVDLTRYTPLCGVFFYDAFILPPQAHHVKGWESRQLLDDGLHAFTYPVETQNPDDSQGFTCVPVGVSVTLPDSVVFLKTPQVARWDAAGKRWRMDGITDISYEETDAKLLLKMDSFQAFVAMQETYANLPLRSWELRPLGENSALFTVSGALISVSITIQGNQCMLLSEQENGLSHLLGKWMSGPALQTAMLNAGINIFVNEHTDKHVGAIKKDPFSEHAAYQQMALFASDCAFSWSKWNAECGAESLVMQACEHQDPDPVPEDSWSLYLLGAQRSQKLEVTERSEAFSTDHYPESEVHSTFIHMLQDSMSAAGIARTRESPHLFVHTVQSLLCATRPLIYS